MCVLVHVVAILFMCVRVCVCAWECTSAYKRDPLVGAIAEELGRVLRVCVRVLKCVTCVSVLLNALSPQAKTRGHSS